LTGWGIDRSVLPVAAASFAESERLPGELLNHFDNGGYLLYRFHPTRRVLISGDTSLYPPSWFREFHREVIGRDADVERLTERFDVRTAILGHASPEVEILLGKLARSDSWALVHLDESASVFVHVEPTTRDLVARQRVDLDERFEAMTSAVASDRSPLPHWLLPKRRVHPAINGARFHRAVGRPDLALELGLAAWRFAHDESLAREIAVAAEAAGTPERAIPALEWSAERSRSKENVSRLARADYLVGIHSLERGDLDLAERRLRRAHDLVPDEPGPLVALAHLEASRGRQSEARELIRRALAGSERERVRTAIEDDALLRPLAVD
jgi:hypothetical protein